jgi:hypothetical protein
MSMFTSISIIVFSAVLFAYWFRYTCLLVLSTRTTKDYARDVVTANQLSYRTVQETLEQGVGQLQSLHSALERDFRLVTYLLSHASELQMGGMAMEDRMLKLDYQMMRMWYSVTRSISATQARKALDEMSQIVGYFANSVGERASGEAGA